MISFLTLDDFYRKFDKETLPVYVNGQVTLFTNDLQGLKRALDLKPELRISETKLLLSSQTINQDINELIKRYSNYDTQTFKQLITITKIETMQDIYTNMILIDIRNGETTSSEERSDLVSLYNRLENFSLLVNQIREFVLLNHGVSY